MNKRNLLEAIVKKAGFKNVSDFAKRTSTYTGKKRNNAMIGYHLTNGCYDYRQLMAYARDLKLSFEEVYLFFNKHTPKECLAICC